ncbi:rhodanese-like domain-containing protein [soil metagenome]
MSATTLPDRVDPGTAVGWARDPDALTVIDVRSPAEFETKHIAGSSNVPLDLLGEHAEQLAARLDRQVLLVCQSGVRSAQAQQRLAGVGMANLHVLEGGVPGYEAAGGDVKHGRYRWSLECQVRMVTGSLVVAGFTAVLWTPKARLLAGAVGAGLAVSALTDTCTMGRVLAALPYNRGPQERTATQVIEQLPTQHPAA